jgi:hypothetical protein
MSNFNSVFADTANFRDDVLYGIADLLTIDRSAGITKPRLLRWTSGINRHLRYAWDFWKWNQLLRVEERAFRPIWNPITTWTAGDEVYHLATATYYQVQGRPIAGTLPTDTIYFTPFTLGAGNTYVEWWQQCRHRIGEVLDVFPSNPTAGTGYGSAYRLSNRGIEIHGGGSTVWVYYKIPPYKFTDQVYDGAKIYVPGDLMLWTDGYVYRNLRGSIGVTPEGDATKWSVVLFPNMFLNYIIYMVAADDADDAPTGQLYTVKAIESLHSAMDNEYVQQGPERYNFMNVRPLAYPLGTSGFLWSTTPPYSQFPGPTITLGEVCDDEYETILNMSGTIVIGYGVTSHSRVVTAPETGTTVVYMAFAPVLSSAPSYVGNPVIKKVSADSDNVFAVSVDSITTGGYNVNLSGPAVAGQTISNIYVP